MATQGFIVGAAYENAYERNILTTHLDNTGVFLYS